MGTIRLLIVFKILIQLKVFQGSSYYSSFQDKIDGQYNVSDCYENINEIKKYSPFL